MKIKGVKEGDPAHPRDRDGRRRSERDAEAQAEGRQEGGRGGVQKIKRAVRKGGKVTATITIKLVDAAGNTRDVKRTVKLTK